MRLDHVGLLSIVAAQLIGSAAWAQSEVTKLAGVSNSSPLDPVLGSRSGRWEVHWSFPDYDPLSLQVASGIRERPTQKAGCPETLNVEGWPIFQEGQGRLNSFVVGDVGDISLGNEAMALSHSPSGFRIWSDHGVGLYTYPIDTAAVYHNTPSLGDLDNDGILEIVVDTRADGMYFFDVVDGKVTAEMIVGDWTTGYWGSKVPVVLDDLDNDDILEIITVEYVHARVHRRDRFGNEYPGWPIQPITPIDPPSMQASAIATGDLDGDGSKEIVVQIYDSRTTDAPTNFAIESDGSIKWSFQIPYDYYQINLDGSVTFNDIVLGDVDNDSFLEVVVFFDGAKAVEGDPGEGDVGPSYVFVLDHTGNLQAEWLIPQAEAVFYNSPLRQFALGDLDGDGDLEIVIGGRSLADEGRTFAWHHDGQLLDGFPIHLADDVSAAPMIADVDDDGIPDIVSSLYTGRADKYLNPIYAWNSQGLLLPCWPKLLIRQDDPPIIFLGLAETVLVDLDGNGTLDLVAPIGSSEVHAIDLEVPVKLTAMDWPMFRHDPQRTGLHSPPVCVADLDGDCQVGVSDLLILLVNWGPCADCQDCLADIDGNCTVGLSDLLILLANWG